VKKTIVSGARPTGRQHLGNYHGALKHWLKLQDTHRCLFFVADWHALTTDYAKPEAIVENTMEMVLDWLAVGLDPARCVMFQQSAVKEHAELFLILGMLTPVPWLERTPTYKEQREQLVDRDLSTYGFLGYPVLQAADILMYKATSVPVGADQVPHVELTREIARRFNHVFGETFPEPQALLAAAPRIPGLDGRKMSKSYNNAVYLTEPAADVEKKLSRMVTDPRRARGACPRRSRPARRRGARRAPGDARGSVRARPRAGRS
jgi:tryptophanyl-tRNA synthetase